MKSELGQEPAFPFERLEKDGREAGMDKFRTVYEHGMSKRFYAACAVMQGILARNGTEYGELITTRVRNAYRIADELLRQENE